MPLFRCPYITPSFTCLRRVEKPLYMFRWHSLEGSNRATNTTHTAETESAARLPLIAAGDTAAGHVAVLSLRSQAALGLAADSEMPC